MLKIWMRRLPFVLVAIGLAVGLSGCLTTQYSARLRYDATKDEFVILNLYQNIHASKQDDAEYLYHRWRNRDHLIRLPNVDVLGMLAFVRLSPTTYLLINLAGGPVVQNAEESAIALDHIRVLPGTFFSRGADDLCFYDQLVIPGTVVDQCLALLTKHIGPGLIRGVDKELQRRKAGGHRTSWAETRQFLKEHGQLPPSPPAADPPVPNPSTSRAANDQYDSGGMDLLDKESLQLLRKGAADGDIKLTREKQVLRVTFPLSNADAGELVELWKISAEVWKMEAAKPSSNPQFNERGGYVVMTELLPAISLTTHKGAVELKIDLAVVAAHLPAIYDQSKIFDSTAIPDLPQILPRVRPTTGPNANATTLPAASPEKPPQVREIIAALRAKGVPVDETLTPDDVLKAFSNATLKSYPSAHPVKPGDGLVQSPAR